MVIRAGETVNGRYRIEELLGQGGMGRVWKAHDQSLDRDVALKEVLPQHGEESAFDRLMEEARLAARLDHPSIVKVHDVFRHRGAPVIVMAFVDGSSLRSRLNEDQAITEDEFVMVALGVLEALGHAHAHGVVHRDLKPENILIAQPVILLRNPEGGRRIRLDWEVLRGEIDRLRPRAVIADFGLARLRSVAPPGTDPSMSGFAGTPAYAAPEQIRGHAATPAFDMWAAGVILYELAEGRRPFSGRDRFELEEQIQYASAPPAPHAGALAGLIRDLLDKDPARRPTAHQARERVEALLVDLGWDGPAPAAQSMPDRPGPKPFAEQTTVRLKNPGALPPTLFEEQTAVRQAPPDRPTPTPSPARTRPGYLARVSAAVVLFIAAMFLPMASATWTDKASGAHVGSVTLDARLAFPWKTHAPKSSHDSELWEMLSWFILVTALLVLAAVIARWIPSLMLWIGIPGLVWAFAVGLASIGMFGLSHFTHGTISPGHSQLSYQPTPLPGVWLLWVVTWLALSALFRSERSGS